MRILWDERKRQANILKHGLDFAALDFDFFTRAVIAPTHSSRLRATGWHDGRLMIAVIVQPLGSEAISIISMRPANFKERRLYDA